MNKDFDKNIDELVSSIASSYKGDDIHTAYGSTVLPNRDEIIEFIKNLRQLFFPEHFGKQRLTSSTMDYYIGNLLMVIEKRLHKQIRLALLHNYGENDSIDEVEVREKAHGICNEFLKTLPKIREVLITDVQAAFDGDPAADDKDQIIFSYPCIFAISVYRAAHELRKLQVPLIPRIMTEYAHSRTGIDINPGATIGRYFFIDHGTGVVIGETTMIGDRVKIYQGVTLGALSTRAGQDLKGIKRHPTIEDNVTIYSGASILGGETIIGKNAVIGGNAFITKSVPAETKVNVKNPELQLNV